MNPFKPPKITFSIRAKILVLFLALSVAALAITGYFAFSAISDVGTYAQESSQTLGTGVVNDSSAALLSLAEDYLVSAVDDRAAIANVVFVDTDSEMDILSAQVAQFQQNPPIQSLVPVYPEDNPPADPDSGALLIFAPTATAGPDSPEAKTLAGLAGALKAVYQSDSDMTSINIATDSGMMLMYPGNGTLPKKFDPRTRSWYTQAIAQDTRVWSDLPYVDAGDNGLTMTCSQAVTSPAYGHWVIGADISTRTIDENIIGPTFGGRGYAVLLNRNGSIISRPGMSAGNVQWNEPFSGENAFGTSDPGLVAIAANMTAGRSGIGRVWFNEKEEYVAYAPVSSMGWSLAISVPVSEITQPVENFTGKIDSATKDTGEHITTQTDRLLTVFVLLFIAILLFVFIVSLLLSQIITKPVASLKEGAGAFGEGDLTYRIRINSGDEFEDLAGSFNAMAEELRQNIETLKKTTAEKERYAKEMEIARGIQTSFLPASMPDLPGYDISAVMIPAMEVGGDFYDVVPLAGGRWAFVIAGVSGKGVSAALFMAMSRMLLRANLEGATDAAGALKTTNRMIAANAPSSMFVTVFVAVLDPVQRIFECISAGHNPPLIVKGSTGEAGYMQAQGIALGVIPEMESSAERIAAEPGDLMILYTDGVTEAFDAGFNAFGEERLAAVAKKARDLPAAAIRDRILSAIREFAGGAPQSDDITLVVIRIG